MLTLSTKGAVPPRVAQIHSHVHSFCSRKPELVFMHIHYFSGLSGISLSWRDFLVALRDFTPPSLWGAGLQPPSGAGLEKVGGLQDVRQLLMDTVLLPAKVVCSSPAWLIQGS